MQIQPGDRGFGPLFDWAKDAARLGKQLGRIRDLMLDGQWRTVEEISAVLEYRHEGKFPIPSVQADLRHLRKAQFGGYMVCVKRRSDTGLHEYVVHQALCACMYCVQERNRREKRRAA